MTPTLPWPPHGARQLRTWMTLGAFLTVACVGPALAASLKSEMGHMAATTKRAKATLGSYDAAKADAVLKAYAEEAQSGATLFGAGGSDKARDFRARFTRLAATADGALHAPGNKAAFRTAFGSIVGQCRSCHSVYK